MYALSFDMNIGDLEEHYGDLERIRRLRTV